MATYSFFSNMSELGNCAILSCPSGPSHDFMAALMSRLGRVAFVNKLVADAER
jgi:hypothetical protein